MSSESAPVQGDARKGRKCEGKKPPHECFGCGKEYTRPHKRLKHMRECCPEMLEKCPTCETGFTNEMGVKVHHARQHGESLSKVDVYCEHCGDFYKRVYKSAEDNYSNCQECRSEVNSERVSGEKNPMHGTGGFVEFDCLNCGKHHRRPARTNTPDVYCDMDCRDAHQVGENNPVYNGGKEHYYGPKWEQQRQKALERDNYRCQSCGKSNEKASIALNVHHIKPYKTFEDKEKAHRLNNLVCLCLSCHSRWEGIPLKPQLL